MIKFKHSGNFNNVNNFLTRVEKINLTHILQKYGEEGVQALSIATPVDSGLTSQSWGYEIHISGSRSSICWTNSNITGNVPVAILLQYGHGTKDGGYVKGRDYINPAIRPIFDRIADEAWKEVTK